MFESFKNIFGRAPTIPEANLDDNHEKSYNIGSATSLADIVGLLQPSPFGSAEFDYTTNLREAYFQNTVSYYCIDLISNLATQPRWELYVNGEEVTNEQQAGEALCLYKFLKRPNDTQTFRDLLKVYITHDYLAGESFLYRIPNNNAIKRGNGKVMIIDPDRVNIAPTEYLITAKDGSKSTNVPKVNPDKSRDVLHRARWHPTSERGFSSLTPAWLPIQNFNNALKWNSSVLNNSARMSLIAVLKSTTATQGSKSALTKDQINDLSNDLARFGTAQGRGKPMVVTGDWDFKEMGQSNKDLEFSQGIDSMSRLIALSFGVDPVLLSLPGDSTYNNKKEAVASLFKLVVLPKLDMLKDDVEYWFRELIGPNTRFELRINRDDIPALEADLEKKWDRQAKAADILTIDERRELLGYGPVEGGDQIKPAQPVAAPSVEFAVQHELISKQSGFTAMQRAGVVPHTRTFDQEQEIVNNEAGMSYRGTDL